MGFGTRTPTSNDPPREDWQYGPQEPHDDFSVLVNSLGKKCKGCTRVTMNKFLLDGVCPECREKQTQGK